MNNNLSKIAGAAILACSLAVLPSNLPAFAQQNDASGSGTTTTAPDNAAASGTGGAMQNQGTDAARDDGFDWGWLGLIGLAGLAGLARKREEPARYRDPGTVGTANTRE